MSLFARPLPRLVGRLACLAGWGLAGVLWGPVSRALAQRLDYTPPELKGIEIADRAGDPVARDVVLRDETGTEVRLADFLDGERPVILALVYFQCPMLCNMVLNGLAEGMKGLAWSPGKEYEVLTVSFDPRDTPEVAAAKKENYLRALDRPGAGDGWHFLTGDEDQVRALANSVGFPYRYLEDTKQFAHGAGIFVLTPDGTVSRTLYGIEFPTRDLRLALVEASEGKLGSPIQRLVLYCFRYSADRKGYVLAAVNVMKLAGVLTVIALGSLVGVLWMRERRKAAGGRA